MSGLHNNTPHSSHGTPSLSQKKPSLFVRFIKSTVFHIAVFFTAIALLGVGYAAWTTLTPAQGASGQVMTQTLMQGIINNLNDLNTRVSSFESGSTTGGTVTGPLRWSSEYSGQNHTAAWNTCLALAPAGAWRLPIADEIEYGRRANGTLFTGLKNYWSSSPLDSSSTLNFLAWSPTYSYWNSCGVTSSSYCSLNDGLYNGLPMVFRCVSNS